jgi:hypothetical protein
MVALTNVHASKIFNPPSTPKGDFARCSSRGYREIKKNKAGAKILPAFSIPILNLLSFLLIV